MNYLFRIITVTLFIVLLSSATLAEEKRKIYLSVKPSDQKVALEFWHELEDRHQVDPSLIQKINQASKIKIFELLNQTYSLETIFYLTSITPSGRNFLDRFLPLYLSKQVTIKDFNDAGEEFSASIKDTRAFYYQGTIYIDFKSRPLPLMKSLVHEGTHAIDLVDTKEDKTLLEHEKVYNEISTMLTKIMASSLAKPSPERERKLQELDNIFYPLLDRLGELDPQRVAIMLKVEHRGYYFEDVFTNEFIKKYPQTDTAVKLAMLRFEMVLQPIPLTQKYFTDTILDSKTYSIPKRARKEYFQKNSWEIEEFK